MVDFDKQRAMAKNRVRRRGIYILPNLFTTAALFAGFYAIVQAMNQRFDAAVIAIYIAMVLDSLDGRVARLTRTQSAFGAEFDSLADMVSFGAAPALIVYEWALKGMGNLGWIAAFVYVAGAALRLARFNVMLDVADKRWFTGIPSPAAAALDLHRLVALAPHLVRERIDHSPERELGSGSDAGPAGLDLDVPARQDRGGRSCAGVARLLLPRRRRRRRWGTR